MWCDFVASILRTPGGAKLWAQTKDQYPVAARNLLSKRLEETEGEPNYMDMVPFSRASESDADS